MHVLEKEPGPLQEQQVHLAAESSFQPPPDPLFLKITYLSFKTGFHSVSLAGLELTM